MQNHIDHDDPRSTAAAALMLARELAPILRGRLPGLLGQTSWGGLAIIADRMNGDQLFGAFVARSLEGLLDQCDMAVRAGTSIRTEWIEARHIGGDAEYEPVERESRTASAEEIDRIAGGIRDLLDLLRRTEALFAANKIVAGRR